MPNKEPRLKIKLTGCWQRTSVAGQTFLSGPISPTLDLVLFQNHRRSERDPHWVAYLCARPGTQQIKRPGPPGVAGTLECDVPKEEVKGDPQCASERDRPELGGGGGESREQEEQDARSPLKGPQGPPVGKGGGDARA